MLISIIIPIYNSEKYLSKCIESVMNQTYQQIEIILVNDGSTDKSEVICNNYMEKDSRILLIEQENTGVSAARNTGIKNATGEYIGFVDSDDYFEHNTVEKVVEIIMNNEADMVIFGYVKQDIIGKVYGTTLGKEGVKLNSEQTLLKILNNNEFQGYVCNKFFSSKVLKMENKILFDKDIYVCEDLLFCCEFILKTEKIFYTPEPLYHYIFHQSNNSAKFGVKKMTALTAYEKIFNLLENQDNEIIKKYKNSYMKINISFLLQYIESKKIELLIYEKLKKNLYRFKIHEISDLVIKISCLVARINPSILYILKKQMKGRYSRI